MRSFIILAFFAIHSLVLANDQVYDPERISKTTLLSDLNRPMELEVAPDGRIFFIELDGAFRVLNPKSREVTEIRKFEVARKGEVGLIGLALDPDFQKNNWVYQTYGKDAGPALNFIHPDYKGKFGLIAPYSKDFCRTCNRLRITSRGDLRLCLFGNTGISIRHLLQNDNQKEELVDLIIKQLHLKKESHYLELGDTGITPNLSTTGG